ncbi:MAG: molecular chaperone GrpE [Thermomicrobiales bacterium]|nr:molecular chaperone GrpE [Thermomicrobiales bacterium]MEA2526188.1 molecular chaperone GrpE [Thermomicrobiales bacterium]MEA2532050.1 molecular chaperone GrpE [Thermomicrobiales bacterium]
MGAEKDGVVTDATKLNGEDVAQAESPSTNGLEPEVGESDLATVAAERDGYLDQLQRTLADFSNFRRRVDQERVQAREVATRDLLRQLVPILDDLQRALGSTAEDQRETPWVQGVQLIERKLVSLLEREGVTPIDALGQPFDPALHEAVASDPGSGGQTVVEVYQSGYRHRNNLLRPAMVRVGDPSDKSQVSSGK